MSGSDKVDTEATRQHVALSSDVQDQIGQQLRKVYGELLAEPLPDKFSKLLSELNGSEPHK